MEPPVFSTSLMQKMKLNSTSIIISISFLVGMLILSSAYKYKFRSNEGISVVGMAQVDFTSDLIVWEGTFNRESPDLKSAYASLKADELLIRSYLKEKGIPDSSIIISSVNLQQEFKSSYSTSGELISNVFSDYSLTQTVKIESSDILKVEKISRESTELIEKGIELSSMTPSYYYTKLSDLKMDLLAKASADAKQRATVISKSVNSSLGNLKKAVMGVFQITGKNSNEEYSYGGSYNTSEKNKTASITIRMDYLLN